MYLAEFIKYFNNVKKTGDNQYIAECPAHNDINPSLSIFKSEEGNILIHCHAGCSHSDILSAVGLKESDLFQNTHQNQNDNIEAVYDYTDENGEYLFSKYRTKEKQFFLGIRCEDGHYDIANIPQKKPLYNLSNLVKFREQNPNEPVYIVEGEKDVETLKKIGLVATTAPTINMWKAEYAVFFENAKVIILYDNDKAGENYRDKIISDLFGRACLIKAVSTSKKCKGDVTDYIVEEGHTKEDLLKLIDSTTWLRPEEKKQEALSISTLAEVETRDVEWLVDKYIPKNKLTIISGDGGSGKTTMWCSIAAAVSNGRPTPLEEIAIGDNYIRKPQNVMFFSSEDTVEEVLKPKIEKHGGNMKNIRFISLADERFKQVYFSSKYLEQLIDDYRPTLVIFDPIQSFIGENVNMIKRNEIRRCMNSLVNICERYDTTILLIAHTNKSSGTWGRKRLADSADLWDMCRTVFITGKLKSGEFYISQEKNNYGEQARTVLFDIEEGVITPTKYVDKHDMDFIREEQYNCQPTPTLDQAKDVIIDTLQKNNGRVESSRLTEIATQHGISEATLKRARKELSRKGNITTKNEGFGRDKKYFVIEQVGKMSL